MALLRPFNCVRPIKEFVEKVAALPYDVVNEEEVYELIKNNSYSFLRVERAEVDFDGKIDPYDKKVYLKAKENFNEMLKNNVYIKEDKPCLYLYKLTMDGRSQIGIVGCTSIDDYLNNIIKKHEHTRKDKEKDRINHVDYLNANTGPIFLTYRNENEIDDLIEKWTNDNGALYDFTSDDNIIHTIWKIDDNTVIQKLQQYLGEMKSVYIADGHHRAASAVKVGMKRRETNKDYTGKEEFNYFLSVLFPHNQLKVFAYNRVVLDLNGNTKEQFLHKVLKKFHITKMDTNKVYVPNKRKTFGMYLDGCWYELISKSEQQSDRTTVMELDVSILQNDLLNPILGIEDPTTSKRIEFVGGIKGIKELEKRVHTDMEVAFLLYPTSIEELMSISDLGDIMPPKSTWFEPKLRSGIFVHEI